ncbi:hypothetical protein [Natrinema gelatinilyticum]|uniref:hypothetical protein n=1 Tax=Natrinema gelatinilyticum TaxID=2961571 RepID=UPI0020C25DD0|nr:hypothetical protein [Natrinema gelatinilyticum]
MDRPNIDAGDMQWGWTCPLCGTDASVSRDADSGTFRWKCDANACDAVGFGFASRRRARLALREYGKRHGDVYR